MKIHIKQENLLSIKMEDSDSADEPSDNNMDLSPLQQAQRIRQPSVDMVFLSEDEAPKWPQDYYVCDIAKAFKRPPQGLSKKAAFGAYFPGLSFKKLTFYNNYNLWIRTPRDFHMKYSLWPDRKRVVEAFFGSLHKAYGIMVNVNSIFGLYFRSLCILDHQFVTQCDLHIHLILNIMRISILVFKLLPDVFIPPQDHFIQKEIEPIHTHLPTDSMISTNPDICLLSYWREAKIPAWSIFRLKLRVAVWIAVLLTKHILSGMFATPMKHVNSESNISKELVVLECPLEHAVVVQSGSLSLCV